MFRRLCLLLVVGALVLSACGDDAATDTSDTTSPPAGTGGDDPSPSAEAAVTIEGLAFDPATLEVAVGTDVTFTNDDGFGHTVTAGSAGDFDESVGAGASVVVTFDEAGTFDYFCTIHPTMTGEVVVS